MKNNPINSLLDISLDNIARMVDINKVVGTPMRVDQNNVVIPISRVTFGFGAGGSEFTTKNSTKAYDLELSEELFPFGGGSLGGISINPSSFVIVNNNEIKIVNSEGNSSLIEKVLEIVKETISSKK